MVQPLWKTVGQFLKMLTIQLSYGPRYLPKKNEDLCPHKHLYTNVRSGTVPNSQSGNNPDVSPRKDGWINVLWCRHAVKSLGLNAALMQAVTRETGRHDADRAEPVTKGVRFR